MSRQAETVISPKTRGRATGLASNMPTATSLKVAAKLPAPSASGQESPPGGSAGPPKPGRTTPCEGYRILAAGLDGRKPGLRSQAEVASDQSYPHCGNLSKFFPPGAKASLTCKTVFNVLRNFLETFIRQAQVCNGLHHCSISKRRRVYLTSAWGRGNTNLKILLGKALINWLLTIV